MNPIELFINKAYEGGWRPPQFFPFQRNHWNKGHEACILLDPEAWKAVGLVENWTEYTIDNGYRTDEWLWNQMRLVRALAEERSIEDFLGELLKV